MPGAIGARQSHLSNLFNQIKKNSSITEKNTSVAINPNDDAHNLLAQKKSHSHGATATKNRTVQSFPVAQQHYQISKSTSSSDVAQVASADMHNVDTEVINIGFDRVRKSPEQFNGKCTWHFSQGSPEILNIINTEKESASGVCEMLSALWIERKLKGSSLQSYLQDQTGKIDPNKIRQVQQLFILGITLNPGAMIEDKNSLGGVTERDALRMMAHCSFLTNEREKFCEYFLTPEQRQSMIYKVNTKKMDGKTAIEQELDKIAGKLSPKQKAKLEKFLSYTGDSLTQPRQQQATRQWLQAKNIQTVSLKQNKLEKNMNHHDFCQQMAEDLVQNNSLHQLDKGYQNIAITQDMSWGHSMSMLVDQNKVDFFDPNCGEFHFDDKKDFVAWWPTFLQLANYSGGKEQLPFNLYQTTLYAPRQ